MTGMVQPDLGPPATKYKEDSIDDPVSIISIGIFFLSSSRLPYRFFCEIFPTSISFLSFLVIYMWLPALCPVGLSLLSTISLPSTWILWEHHGQYPNQTAFNSGCQN